MSFSASVIAEAESAGQEIHDKLREVYPDLVEAEHGLFQQIKYAVEDTLEALKDKGHYSVSVSGHVNGGEEDSMRSSASISLQPATTPAEVAPEEVVQAASDEEPSADSPSGPTTEGA